MKSIFAHLGLCFAAAFLGAVAAAILHALGISEWSAGYVNGAVTAVIVSCGFDYLEQKGGPTC